MKLCIGGGMEAWAVCLLLAVSVLTVVNTAISVGITHNMRWFERLRADTAEGDRWRRIAIQNVIFTIYVVVIWWLFQVKN